MKLLKALLLTSICSISVFANSAKAESLTLICNYKEITRSINYVVDKSREYTIDIDTGRVSGYKSVWQGGGVVVANVTSSKITITDTNSTGEYVDLFVISRIDGEVSGGRGGDVFNGSCTKSADRAF